MSKSKHQRVRSLKKAKLRIFEKIRQLIKEMHCKMTNYILENFDIILIPAFDVSTMSRRKNLQGMSRKLSRSTVRSMLTWSHYQLRERMLFKAQEYKKQVEIVDEIYTR